MRTNGDRVVVNAVKGSLVEVCDLEPRATGPGRVLQLLKGAPLHAGSTIELAALWDA